MPSHVVAYIGLPLPMLGVFLFGCLFVHLVFSFGIEPKLRA
jgi:hypothetical protein